MRRAHRFFSTLVLGFMASTGVALAKDSVTIGMVLEPPGLDPTAAPAAAIGEVTHYNIFEGLTKINEDFSVTPLLAEKWVFSPDLKTLTFTLKPNIKFQDDEPFSSKDVKFSFERFAAKESTNKDKAFFASIEFDRHARSDDGGAQVQAAELRGALSISAWTRPSSSTRRARRAKPPTPSAPDLTSSPPGTRARRSRSTSGTAIATRRRSRSLTRPSASSPIPRPRSRRCSQATSTPSRASPIFRRSASSRAIRASRSWSAGPRARPSSP